MRVYTVMNWSHKQNQSVCLCFINLRRSKYETVEFSVKYFTRNFIFIRAHLILDKILNKLMGTDVSNASLMSV